MNSDARTKPKKKSGVSIANLVLVLTATAVFFTGALAFVFDVTKATIEANARRTFHRALMHAFGLNAQGDLESSFEEHIETKADERLSSPVIGGVYYLAYEDRVGGKRLGYAVRAATGGFQGIVDLVIAFRSDLEDLIGLAVADTGETPGLGFRILEEWFPCQFKGLATEPRVDYAKVPEPKLTKEEMAQCKHDPAFQPIARPAANTFVAVTGATYTTSAVRDLINRAKEQMTRVLREEE